MRLTGAASVLQETLDVFPQQIVLLDGAGTITHTNEAWLENARINGHQDPTPDAFIGVNYLAVCQSAALSEDDDGDTARQTFTGLQAVLGAKEQRFNLEYPCHSPDQRRWFVVDVVPLRSEPGAAVIHTDVTEYKKQQLHAAHLASLDPLTGLANRLFFQMQGAHLLSSAQRHGRTLHLLYMDLNGFKQVNDTLGHEAGDELLCQVAERFKARVRGSDLLGRWGGDEFIALVENAPSSHLIGERYLQSLDDFFTLRGRHIHLGMSIGVSEFPKDGITLQHLMRRADAAMYRAKREGGGVQVVVEAN